MRLKVFLPTEVLIDQAVRKVVAQAANGSFALLPRHIDFVAALIPSVLIYVDEGGCERFVGVDEGILIKRERNVLVSTRKAVRGDDLDALHQLVRHEIMELDEHERAARGALARLEAGVIRHFIDVQERS
jgi:F-type H+-transporting ATPase subunit epsilon